MSYTVLARKWRPQKFEDVVGQTHVVKGLKNAIDMGRTAHAYLFSGTRGVGKTTTARILARALNCSEGPTSSPCGNCSSCTETASGTSVDVIEIDGASNTGVEDVRTLRENAQYAPAKSRYKVYIIDEVHMLSNSAFNALLKILEEPPSHVVFIFATTDPHKLPPTILSRCQHYDFRRVPRDLIQANLRDLSDREGFKVDDEALKRLSSLAEGSIRDSLSLLDQVISFAGEEGLKASDIDDILGLVGKESVRRAASCIIGSDPAGAVGLVAELVDRGIDLRRFAVGLLEHYRDLMIARLPAPADRALELSEAEAFELREQAKGSPPDEIIRVMNLLARLVDDMRRSENQRITLELALVKAASRPIATIDDVIKGISKAKSVPHSAPPPPMTTMPQPKPAPKRASGSVRQPKADVPDSSPAPSETATEYPGADELASETAASVNRVASTDPGPVWEAVVSAVKSAFPDDGLLHTKLDETIPVSIKDNKFEYTIKGGILNFSKENEKYIEGILGQVTGSQFRFIKVSQDKAKGKKSLSEVNEKRENDRVDKIKNEALEHPLVKSALDLFGGEVIGLNKDDK